MKFQYGKRGLLHPGPRCPVEKLQPVQKPKLNCAGGTAAKENGEARGGGKKHKTLRRGLNQGNKMWLKQYFSLGERGGQHRWVLWDGFSKQKVSNGIRREPRKDQRVKKDIIGEIYVSHPGRKRLRKQK